MEPPAYYALTRLARREGTSISLKARDLLREALDIHEDRTLARIGAERDRTFTRSRALSHAEVWRRRRIPRR